MSKFNDIDIKLWKDYGEIKTDSLWIIDKRDNSGSHVGDYHGNFVPQIPHQLFTRYTKKGDWILDPFMGSGTSLIEAQRMKRNAIGIDLKQKITIQSSSGMSKEDIDRMVKEAAAHEAEDKKQREAADAKNEAEQTVYQAEKTCKDFEGKVDESLIKDVRAAADILKNDLNSADTDSLKKKTEDVRQALYKLSSAAYQSGAAGQQGNAGADFTQQANNSSSDKNDDGTIDAEYTEVDKDKK